MHIEDSIKQPDFHTPTHKAFINILYTAGYLEGQMHLLLKPYALSHQQYNALRILRGAYPNAMMLSAISDRMLDKSSNCSRLIEKLHQKKLVQRETDPDNRRRLTLRITPKGREIMADLDSLVAELIEKQIKLPPKAALQLSDWLDAIRD